MVNAATRILLSKTGRRTLYTILLAISAWLVISLVLARMETQRDFSSRLRRMQTFYRGLLNYRDVHDGFPTIVVGTSEGSSLYSWRLALWPFIEKPPVYIRQESAWNSAANMAVREFNARLFSWHLADSGNARLITVSVCGDGTVWGNAITTLPERVPLAMEWPCNLEHWSQPGDFVVRGPLENSPLHESLGIECRILILLTTGEICSVSPQMPTRLLTWSQTWSEQRFDEYRSEFMQFATIHAESEAAKTKNGGGGQSGRGHPLRFR